MKPIRNFLSNNIIILFVLSLLFISCACDEHDTDKSLGWWLGIGVYTSPFILLGLLLSIFITKVYVIFKKVFKNTIYLELVKELYDFFNSELDNNDANIDFNDYFKYSFLFVIWVMFTAIILSLYILLSPIIIGYLILVFIFFIIKGLRN